MSLAELLRMRRDVLLFALGTVFVVLEVRINDVTLLPDWLGGVVLSASCGSLGAAAGRRALAGASQLRIASVTATALAVLSVVASSAPQAVALVATLVLAARGLAALLRAAALPASADQWRITERVALVLLGGGTVLSWLLPSELGGLVWAFAFSAAIAMTVTVLVATTRTRAELLATAESWLRPTS